MIESFAEAAAVLEREDYREIAERNAGFIVENLTKGGRLLHVYEGGRAKHAGLLDDYSYVFSALVTLFETTGKLRWFEEALSLTERMIDEFWDDEDGGFFYNGRSGEKLIVRNKDYFDNAAPSGNSVAAESLLRLSVLTGNDDYRRKAVNVLRLVRDAVERYPSAFGYALGAIDFHLSKPKEIVIIGDKDVEGARLLEREIWSRYLPNKVVVKSAGDDARASELIPLLRDRQTIGGRATRYVCEKYNRRPPPHTPQELAAPPDADAGGTPTQHALAVCR